MLLLLLLGSFRWLWLFDGPGAWLPRAVLSEEEKSWKKDPIAGIFFAKPFQESTAAGQSGGILGKSAGCYQGEEERYALVGLD